MYSVLYVDDEEELLGITKIFLEKTGDFSVGTANSAHTALEMIAGQSYDAIVSDYEMPGMDGLTFLRTVRTQHGNLPFLLFTGKGREEVVIEAVDHGVDYYIQKGPDLQCMYTELRHKITRAIERRKTRDELEQSRQQLDDIINFLPDATFVRDTRGRVIAWNRAMETMTGLRREEIIGAGELAYSLPFYHEKRPLLADLVLEPNPAVEAQYRFFERTGDKIVSEIFIPHFNNGAGAYLWTTASALYDARGNVTGAIESFRDISDTYAVRKDLGISREMALGFSELLPIPIFEMDLDWYISFYNQATLDCLGYRREDFDRKASMLEFLEPGDWERAIASLNDVVAGRRADAGEEFQLVKKDGSVFSAHIYAGKIGNPDTGEPAGVRGVIFDLTERKREAQALLESRERLACAMDAGDLGIWDVDMETNCVHGIERWAYDTLGYQPDEDRITVATCRSVVHPLDLLGILYAFSRHLMGKPLFEAEFRLPHKDGSWRWVAVRGKVIEWDANHRPRRITGTINEVTHHPKKSWFSVKALTDSGESEKSGEGAVRARRPLSR